MSVNFNSDPNTIPDDTNVDDEEWVSADYSDSGRVVRIDNLPDSTGNKSGDNKGSDTDRKCGEGLNF